MRRCAVERRFQYFASVVVKEKSKPESETAVEGFVGWALCSEVLGLSVEGSEVEGQQMVQW